MIHISLKQHSSQRAGKGANVDLLFEYTTGIRARTSFEDLIQICEVTPLPERRAADFLLNSSGKGKSATG